jgi:hypothetical protein
VDGDDDDVVRTPPKVARYVNHWPHLFPNLCEPATNFNVPAGGIPPPGKRGNIGRRMRSMRSILGRDNSRIQQWKDVSADTKVSHESRLLAFGIFEVMWELDANHLPVPDGNKTIRDLNTYHICTRGCKWSRYDPLSFKHCLYRRFSIQPPRRTCES